MLSRAGRSCECAPRVPDGGCSSPPAVPDGGRGPWTRTRRIGCALRAIRRNRLRACAKSTRIAQFGFR
ncbi:hypothetical protein C6P74_04785 [Burkholderia multivorans]|nr:hypothetical protein C6P74_04785 [Burkholderia multivorans]PRE83301.1 hypothetical protein C6Q02_16930 [Burkholderia multivorans]